MGPHRATRAILAAGLLTGLFLCAGAAAQPETPPETPAAQDESRLDRLLHRFFGNRKPSGEELEGRAVSAVDRFAADAGDHIEVVLVHPVTRFESRFGDDASRGKRLLGELARPLQSYTNDRVIRDYLLFERGQELDPYLLADSERLLRRLPYISDAKLTVVPLNASGDTVAVVVQTVDRWPIGFDVDVKSADEFRGDLYSVNLRGTGVGWSNRILYRDDGEPRTGYRGLLYKENLTGRFWNLEAEFADSPDEKRLRGSVERTLAHPGINVLGGASWNRYQGRRDNEPNAEVVTGDAWVGRVHRMYDRRTVGRRPRSVLVPALRVEDVDYLSQSTVPADSNLVLYDNRLYLAALSYHRLKYYQTSFLLGLGETENVPRGVVVKLTGGYQDSDANRRMCLFLDTGLVSVRQRGDLVYVSADWGGFFRNQRIEEGLLRLDGRYYTSLVGGGAYRTRFNVRVEYTLGIRRAPGQRLMLRRDLGQRLLPEEEVVGNQRLVTSVEANLFTPWSLAGFRVSWLSFTDLGLIGPENADSLWQERVYYGAGVGVNLRNPDLALPTWRITAAVRNRVEDGRSEFVLGFRSVSTDPPVVPSAKPSLLVYR